MPAVPLRLGLALLLGLAGSLQVRTSIPPQDLGGPASEPPPRARVSLGDVAVELDLGERGVLLDGRPLTVELLNERRFEVEGVLAFAYPRAWSFVGAVGVPSPVDAWWTLNGAGGAVHLRRHGEGAQAIADLYVENLGKVGGSPPTPVTRRFGARTLTGRAVELTVGDTRGGAQRRQVQEVFGWEQAPGVAWMVALQRDLGPVGETAPVATWTVGAPLTAPDPLERIRAGFEWDDGR